ncbi:Response regulator PleD [compost metagenome]
MELSRALLNEAALSLAPVSVILMDIDFFKNINDRYGHHYGDMALQHIVTVCSSHLREGDIFGRYGGEEFVLCLPGTSLKQAALLSESMRKDIERSSISTLSGPIHVTASFGVVEARGKNLSLEDLLSEADHALYTSKRNGRNAVHVSSGSSITHFTPV